MTGGSGIGVVVVDVGVGASGFVSVPEPHAEVKAAPKAKARMSGRFVKTSSTKKRCDSAHYEPRARAGSIVRARRRVLHHEEQEEAHTDPGKLFRALDQ